MTKFQIKCILIACLLLMPLAQSNAQGSLSIEEAPWMTRLGLGVDISSYDNVNIDGGQGFTYGLLQYRFFNENIGAFVGLEQLNRKMEIGVGSSKISESVGFIEIPVGLSFRRGAFGDSAMNFINLGLYFSEPQENFRDSFGPVEVDGGNGLYFGNDTLFDLNPNWLLGFHSVIRFGLFETFPEVAGGDMFSFNLGFSLAYRY